MAILPSDDYCLMTIFLPCPEVVIISNTHCSQQILVVAVHRGHPVMMGWLSHLPTHHCKTVADPEPLPVPGALRHVHVLAVDGQHVRLRFADDAPESQMIELLIGQHNRREQYLSDNKTLLGIGKSFIQTHSLINWWFSINGGPTIFYSGNWSTLDIA